MATSVLLLAEHRISSVAIIESMLGHLDRTRGLPWTRRLLHELSVDDFRAGTMPLLVRGSNQLSFELARAMQRTGVRYGYYLDDNVWALDPEHQDGRYWRSGLVSRRLATILRGADPILVATPALATYLERFHERVHVASSFFDFRLVPEMPAPPPARERIRGGFASSPGRADDLLAVLPDIVRLLDHREDFEFEIIGADPELLPHHQRLRWFPYLPGYEEYSRFQSERQWDFGIAPLLDTPSNQYKTDNKYREYAARGIPGIYEDAHPYRAVRDTDTGLKAGAIRPWRDAISMYLDSADLRLGVRARARADAERRLSLEAVAPSWQRIVETAPGMDARATGLRRTLLRLRKLYAQYPPSRLQAYLQAADVALAAEGFAPTVGRAVRHLGRRAARRDD